MLLADGLNLHLVFTADKSFGITRNQENIKVSYLDNLLPQLSNRKTFPT